jgi:hypothetical protein
MSRKEPQPLSTTYVVHVQNGKNGSIQKNKCNPPQVVVKKPAPPSPPPPPKAKSQ